MIPALRSANIRYVFLGRELGARRIERECYVDGKVDYELVAQLPSFREGLERVRRGVRRFTVALLCAEKDPITCHRTILVARQLREEVDISHILFSGLLEQMHQAEERLLRSVGLVSGDLFCSRAELVMRAYRLQGQRIAYVEPAKAQKAATP